MKKALLFVIVFSIFAISISTAQSFGIKMGMTYDDLVSMGCKPTPTKELNRYFVTPPTPHPFFAVYGVEISPTYGVYQIVAFSKDINTSSDGTQLKNSFNDIKRQISITYGQNQDSDSLHHGSIWKEDSEWMMSLYKKDRDLDSFWDRKAGSKMPDDLTAIMLSASASSTSVGYLGLVYVSINDDKAQAEKESVQGSVF